MGGGDVPDGYDKDVVLGRPVEKASDINTQENPLGKDRLGKKDNKVDDQSTKPNLNFKGNSPLALEVTFEYLKNKQLLENLVTKKKMVFEKEYSGESSLLDENQLEK